MCIKLLQIEIIGTKCLQMIKIVSTFTSKQMKMITIQELEDIEYRVVLHSKKVNTYTHVEFIMLYRINQDTEYAVNKKQKRVYTSDNLDGALEQYNKIQSFK